MSNDCAPSFLSLDITDYSIIEQIYLIKEERNLSEEEIKRPSPDTEKNITRGRLGYSYNLFNISKSRFISIINLYLFLLLTVIIFFLVLWVFFFSDPEDLRRENQELRRMMLCKSCKISKATCVNMNIMCRHLLCSNCCDVLTACKKCRAMITATAPVKFGNE